MTTFAASLSQQNAISIWLTATGVVRDDSVLMRYYTKKILLTYNITPKCSVQKDKLLQLKCNVSCILVLWKQPHRLVNK